MQLTGDFSDATPRQIKLLELLCEGCDNPEIAAEVGLKPRTVKAHFNRLFLRHRVDGGVKRVKLAVLYYRWQCAQTFAARNQKR